MIFSKINKFVKRIFPYALQTIASPNIRERKQPNVPPMDASITKANYLTARRSGIVARNSEHGGAIRGEKGERRKETVPRSTRNLHETCRYDVITKRQEGRGGGCFGPLSSLLSLTLGEWLQPPFRGRS